MHEQALSGGRFAAATRDGDTITRRAGPGAANIHALLDHLAAGGFALAPRVLCTSDDDEQERLSFPPGTAEHPPLPAAIRSAKALRSAARGLAATRRRPRLHATRPGWLGSAGEHRAGRDRLHRSRRPRPLKPDLRRRPGHRHHRLRLHRTLQSGLGSRLPRSPTGPVPSHRQPGRVSGGTPSPTALDGCGSSPPPTTRACDPNCWSTTHRSGYSAWPPTSKARSGPGTRRSPCTAITTSQPATAHRDRLLG